MNVYMALDPGGTTGVSVVTDEDEIKFGRSQIGGLTHHQVLYDCLTSYQPSVVICESFVYQQRINVNLISVEYIGVVRLWCLQNDCPLEMQHASQVKRLWSDDKIKRMGLWIAGQPHAMDATRHALHFLVFKRGRKDLLDKLRNY